jgi:serine phosphatase RsbU (regulator of sigma subunit)
MKMKNILQLLLLTSLLFKGLSFSLFAQELENIILTDGKEGFSIGKQLYYLEDASQKLTLEEILTPENQAKFIKSESDNLNLGFSKSAYWIRIDVKNQSTINDWLFDVAYPNFDYLDFYYQDSTRQWQVKNMGDMLPFNSRPLPIRKFAFPLLASNRTETYYLRALTNGIYVFPIDISRPSTVYFTQMKEDLVYGIYYGLMMVMCLYNFLIYISLKDKNYLYYSLSILAITFYIFSLYHHGFQYIWTESPIFHNYSLNVSLGFWLMIVSTFAAKFLELKRYSKLLHYSFRFLTVLGAIELILIFLIDRGALTRLNSMSILLTCTLLISGGVYAFIKGNVAAKHFILAWSAFLTGAIIFSIRSFGKLPNNFFTEHSVEIGSALEVILIAFALTTKYQELKKERDKAKAEALEVLKEANENLERKVTERTKEIQHKQEEILVQNEELHQQQEEITAQRDFIEQKNKELTKQNDMILEQHKQITDSIRYALTIQHAILPEEDLFKNAFSDYFIIFRPKDIVSGDFYWYVAIPNDNYYGERHYLACVDCTGHGVPGGFMSMIGYSLLNEIVSINKIKEPSSILEHLNLAIRHSLQQNKLGRDANTDGMDITLVMFEKLEDESTRITFSGAKTTLYYMHKNRNEVLQIKGDKKTIGGVLINKERQFTDQQLLLKEGDTLYLMTDGFCDQNNSQRIKFGTLRFVEMLQQMAHQPLEKQKDLLEFALEDHQGDSHQRDDITVLGVRL